MDINDPGFQRSDKSLVWRIFRVSALHRPQRRTAGSGAVEAAADAAASLAITDPQGRQALCGLPVPIGDGGDDVVEAQPPETVFEVSPPIAGSYRVDFVSLDPGDHAVEALSYDLDGAVTTP